MNRRNFLVGSAVTPVAIPFASWGKEFKFPLVPKYGWQEVETYDDLRQAVWEATLYLNKKFNGKIGPSGSRSYKGNPYKTFAVGGYKPEGTVSPGAERDLSLALWMWFDPIFEESHKGGDLVWRTIPEVSRVSFARNSGWDHSYQIRSRLVFE